MLIFCLFYISNTYFPKKIKNKKLSTCSSVSITDPPPPTLPAPLERNHQCYHQPSTTTVRSTPQPVIQLPPKKKKKKTQHLFISHSHQTIHQKFSRYSTPKCSLNVALIALVHQNENFFGGLSGHTIWSQPIIYQYITPIFSNLLLSPERTWTEACQLGFSYKGTL